MTRDEFKTLPASIILEHLKHKNPGAYQELLDYVKAQIKPTKSPEEASKDLLESISGSRK